MNSSTKAGDGSPVRGDRKSKGGSANVRIGRPSSGKDKVYALAFPATRHLFFLMFSLL